MKSIMDPAVKRIACWLEGRHCCADAFDEEDEEEAEQKEQGQEGTTDRELDKEQLLYWEVSTAPVSCT